MSNQESNEIGKVFRSAIDGISIPPPSGIWENLRLLAIQTQLLRYKKYTQWLGIYASLVTILLGGAMYLLFLKKTADVSPKAIDYTRQHSQAIQHDTILIRRNVVKYVYLNNLTTPENVPNNLIENHNIGNRNLNALTNDKNSTSDTKNIVTDPNPSLSTAVESQEEILTAKEGNPYIPFNSHFGLPSMGIPKTSVAAVSATKPQSSKTPFINRLAISAFYSPEWGDLTVYRSEPEAFNYGNETIEKASSYGLRASFDLNSRLSISTGIEWSSIQFASAIRKFPIQAELVNGQVSYLYKTVFGVATIPNDEMTTIPAIGNTISLESEDEHKVSFVKIPISLKYNVFQLKLKKTNRNQKYLALYGIGGLSYNMPYRQALQVEIYEPDGHDFYATLGSFSNTQSFWSYNLGIGAEMDLSHNTSVWLEPYYNKTINSFVRDLPLQSYVHNLGLKVGLKWHF
jgi:hypothetical protein